MEEARLEHSAAVVGVDCGQGEQEPEEPQLYVPQPDGHIGPLQDLLEVDPGEPGGQAGRDNCAHADHRGYSDPRLVLRGLALRQLHQRHAREQQREREPLEHVELATQQQDGEQRGCQDLQLVCDLRKSVTGVRSSGSLPGMWPRLDW